MGRTPFSSEFSRRMALLAIAVGCIVCFVLPVTYFYMSLADKKNQASIRGEVLAKSMESTVKANLDLWYYDVPKFVEIFEGISQYEGVEALRIFDAQSRLIYEKRISPRFWMSLDERTSIRYNNQVYGYVEFEYGLNRIAYTLAGLLTGFVVFGFLIAVVIYKYPTSIVCKAEQKIMEAMRELEESEARYRAVMEQSPEAIVLVDPANGDIVEANARFSERFGYDLNQKSVLTLYELMQDEIKMFSNDLESVSMANGVLPLQRKLLRLQNGNIINIERTAKLVRYRNRQLFMMVMRDVSDEVRREQEIRRDAQLAARVQTALLMEPQASEQLDVSIVYHPYTYVGGDLYFMDWRYRGQVLRGFLVDASGHGLGTSLHTAALHVLLREVNEFDLPLTDTMRWLNRRTSEYFEDGAFAGALVFELDMQIGQLRWACAGIPEIWVSTDMVTGVIAKPGMYLSIRDDEYFEMHTLPVSAGDSFYFMTDGLSDIIEQKGELPLAHFSDMVLMLRTLSEAAECRDDATALCIHVKSLMIPTIGTTSWPCIINFSSFGDYQRLKSNISDVIAEVTGKRHSRQEVAVNEALVNALECRDGVPRQHKAQIRFNMFGGRFVVRVKTSRIGFSGNSTLKRLRSHPEDMFSFGEEASMGRGIPMMLSLSDKMMYNSEGTELLLAWRL